MNSSVFLHRRGRIAAFTLIELLTVMVIIAVLAGILMPVASAIKARADGTQCASNLRQIGAAIGGYAADHDGTLPGPLATNQLPTYTNTDANSLAGDLINYLGLPAATGAPQKAPLFLCPAYARAFPKLDQPVYAVQQVTQAAGAPWPFGYPGDSTQPPMKLGALSTMVDGTGQPISLANTIALRDFQNATGTLNFLGGVTYSSAPPVHKTFLNALFFDWHVGPVNISTLAPQ